MQYGHRIVLSLSPYSNKELDFEVGALVCFAFFQMKLCNNSAKLSFSFAKSKDHGICILLQFGKICQWKIAPTHMRPIFVQKKPRLSLLVKKSLTLQKVEFFKYLWREIGSLCLVQFPSNLAPAILFQSLTTWRGKRD